MCCAPCTRPGGILPNPITLRSSCCDCGQRRPRPAVSGRAGEHLFYQGRAEDLAFEKPDGTSADRRQHVRFWEVSKRGEEGKARVARLRDVLIAAWALSRLTARSHHHIAPNIDAERDQFTADLKTAKVVEAIYEASGVGPTLNGRNGRSASVYTDGESDFPTCRRMQRKSRRRRELDNPPLVDMKNGLGEAIAALLSSGAPTTIRDSSPRYAP